MGFTSPVSQRTSYLPPESTSSTTPGHHEPSHFASTSSPTRKPASATSDDARQQGQVSRVPRRVRVAAEPSAQAFLLYSSRQLAWIRWPQSSAVAPSPRSSKHTGHGSTRGGV